MCRRIKRALVESYVGAIALGWLLAQGVLHFVNVFAAPVASWIQRREFANGGDRFPVATGFSLQDCLPELIRFVALLAIWSILFRWLYLKPLDQQAADAASNQVQGE